MPPQLRLVIIQWFDRRSSDDTVKFLHSILPLLAFKESKATAILKSASLSLIRFLLKLNDQSLPILTLIKLLFLYLQNIAFHQMELRENWSEEI
jgi:hypothetical protein